MSIRIVTDSTCDLPAAMIADHGITVVPAYVNMDGQSYLDGVELSRPEFYEQLPHCQSPPTTSAPGPGTFTRVYEQLAHEGATGILSVHISVTLSNIVNVARMAAEETEAVPVTVFDSRQLTSGTGLLSLTAARAAAAGRPMAEIVALLEDQVLRTHSLAVLDTLEYLRRSGRVTWFRSGLGTLLKIKPLLTMYNGATTVEAVRTRTRAYERLIDMVSALGPLEQLALVHTHAPDRVEALRQQARHLFPGGQILFVEEATPLIGAHIGPGAVCFVCVTAGAV
jgi:DegV family protein with EDD domain